ncbi:hypothetical protein ES703_73994 [subsurface metagenome]
MNVTSLITVDYENKSNWTLGENKPKTNPIKPNTKPIKANKIPKQTQYKPNQTQLVVSLSNLFQNVERLLALEQIAAIIILIIEFLENYYV